MARSSSSDGAPQEKDEVFISFRADRSTRQTYIETDLYRALLRHGIRAFKEGRLGKGDEIPTPLLRAIEDAKLSVIVFSNSYAKSMWCLDVLLKILECQKTRGQIVFPVFYDIDPSFVRNQLGSYADAFDKHEEKFKGNMMKVQRWRDALAEAASYPGWDCTNRPVDDELVEEIAKDVLEKLNRKDEQLATPK